MTETRQPSPPSLLLRADMVALWLIGIVVAALAALWVVQGVINIVLQNGQDALHARQRASDAERIRQHLNQNSPHQDPEL